MTKRFAQKVVCATHAGMVCAGNLAEDVRKINKEPHAQYESQPAWKFPPLQFNRPRHQEQNPDPGQYNTTRPYRRLRSGEVRRAENPR